MEALCRHSLITVFMQDCLKCMNHTQISQHPGCFPVRTILLKAVCLSAWKYYLFFFFFFFPQILLPSASSCFEQMALSRFRWVFVYTLPTHEADFALHKTVSHHQSSVNGQDRAVVLHPWEPNLAIISTHPEQP